MARTLLCDANVPARVVDSIRALNIAAIPLRDIPEVVKDDKRVVELAHSFNAIIVTIDKDFTTNQPLLAAMVASGSRIVILRPPKCVPNETMETIARLILDNHRKWQVLLDSEPGIISCNKYGNRLRKLKEFPWYKQIEK